MELATNPTVSLALNQISSTMPQISQEPISKEMAMIGMLHDFFNENASTFLSSFVLFAVFVGGVFIALSLGKALVDWANKPNVLMPEKQD